MPSPPFSERRLLQGEANNMRIFIAIVLSAVMLASCTQESNNDVTGSIGNCARKMFSSYNPKDIKQCVAVCISCDRGQMSTCSTSCTMKGAR